MGRQNYYICIDLKSFYASVECVERGLDPFQSNLVVADPERSKSTICLAITPAMKRLGVKNRYRIHEIPDHIQFTVEDTAEVQKIEMKDDVTKVEISKTDVAGKELPGAKLTIFDEEGNIVESWTSKDQPHYIEMLPIGTYKLKLNGGDIKAVQGDSGHAQVNMVTDVYSHILDDDRKKNAELFEDAFYGKKETDPQIHRKKPENTIKVPEGVDAELLTKVLSNPEMAALLASLAKTMKV